jgi:tRNA threonylcarbamoyladenosine biosynthesis protein TsaB
MKVLAVDTSSVIAAVAVMDNDTLLCEYILNDKKTHSQKLMPMISEIMRNTGLTPKDIDVFAASTGPGSFTGLRIGITTIKAMAYAAQKPAAGIPTLDVLAFNIPLTENLVCPIMDARNNQVYTAVYMWKDSRQKRITDYMGIHVNELADLLKEKNKNVIFAGDGIYIHTDYFHRQLGEKCIIAPGSHRLQRASAIASLAMERATQGLLQKSEDLVPFYLRKSQAEMVLERKKKNRD